MQPPFAVKQCEPYILKQVLLPTQQSSFIHSLIVAYNKKLSVENDQFLKEFIQKQKKFQRHKEQLNLLPEIKSDPKLMSSILQQIVLKEYEKQYAMILVESEKKHQRFFGRKTQSIKNNSVDKENCNKTFHFNNKNTKNEFSVDMKNTQRDEGLFRINQTKKKFRTSMVKSSSFSGIKRPKTPFSTKTNGNIESMRNSEDAALPAQSGLRNYFNLKDNKLSEALYGKKRPGSKGSTTTHLKRESQMSIKKKNISNLSPEWMREYLQKQKERQKQMINSKPPLHKYTKITVQKNSIKQKQLQQQKEFNVQFEDVEQFQKKAQKKLTLSSVDNNNNSNNDTNSKQRASFEQQQQTSSRRLQQRPGGTTQSGHVSRRGYATKMQLMARNIQCVRENIIKEDNKMGSPYHISNFIKQLDSYNISSSNNSHSAHNLGKLSHSRRKFVHQKNDG